MPGSRRPGPRLVAHALAAALAAGAAGPPGSGSAWADGTPSAPDCDYQFDNAVSTAVGIQDPAVLMWLHRFEAADGQDTIWAIQTTFGSPTLPGGVGVDAGDPVGYVIYEAAAGGAPGALLFEGTAVIEEGTVASGQNQVLPVPGVEVTGEFFVGVYVVDPGDGFFPAPLDQSVADTEGNVWIAAEAGDFGSFDPGSDPDEWGLPPTVLSTFDIEGVWQLCVTGASGSPCPPGLLFCDDFSSGVIDEERYSTFGGASMWIEDGRLMVHMPGPDSGLEINIEDFGTKPRCFDVHYEIPEDGFPVGSHFRVEIFAESHVVPGAEFVATGVNLWRPFWNRCVFSIQEQGQHLGCIGFSTPISGHEPITCSALAKDFANRLRIDVLEKAVVDCNNNPPDHPEYNQAENPNNAAKQRIQIELDNMAHLPEGGLLRGIRIEGCHRANFNDWKPGEQATTRVTIGHFVGEFPPGTPVNCVPAPDPRNGNDNDNDNGDRDGGSAGDQSITVAIDMVALDDEHPPEEEPLVSVIPTVFEPGEVAEVTVHTAQSVLNEASTLGMGADVLIHSFEVLGPQLGVAVIEIDERAHHTGHLVVIRSEGVLNMGMFVINPPDPEVPLPENEGPTLEVIIPPKVAAGESFPIETFWDDPDDAWIRGLVVIMELPSEAEIFDSDYFFIFPTHPEPVHMTFEVPGLEPGLYKVVSVADDGLAPSVVVHQHLKVIGEAPPCPGDLTGSGTVGVDDLLSLLALWGECPDCDDCPADLTGDCAVGVDDLLTLLANWGDCPAGG